MPDHVVQAEVARGEVLLALQEYRLSIFGGHMYLMYLPNRHQTRAVRTCIDFLLAKAGRGPARRPGQEAPHRDINGATSSPSPGTPCWLSRACPWTPAGLVPHTRPAAAAWPHLRRGRQA